MKENTYSSFQSASDANFELLKQLYGNSEKFKLIKPNRINSVYDGIITTKKNDKDYCIMIEVKLRQFSMDVLINDYKKDFFLEKDKCLYLRKSAEEFAKVPGRVMKIWYLCMTSDKNVFIFDITDNDYTWIPQHMNAVSYSKYQKKIQKYVALLNIDDADYSFKIK